MEGKNIPPFITLTAALIACMICIIRGATLFTTLKIVLIVMIVFYIIGRMVQKVLVKIDNDAENAALQRQKEEQERAARDLEEAELAKTEQEAFEKKETENIDNSVQTTENESAEV